jgi:sterol desaturase/sphingolipid hydroxylase (fatty acid hydroxylase superfamily)
MPYAVVLALQVGTLCMMVLVFWKAGANNPHRRLGNMLIGLAVVYVVVMLVRMIIGILELSSARWFDGAVSTAFHFVLAAFLLTLGALLTAGAPVRRWKKKTRATARYIAYPTLIVFGYAMFVWLRATGAPLLFSSYLSTFLAIVGVILHETLSPARSDWRPVLKEVLQDGLFVAIVQLGIPVTLKALTLLLLVRVSDFDAITESGIWPHDAPILVQIGLMMIIAEFFRYWIHRTLHTYMPLWKLHAVHHASDKLYTINVGRFHPFDKAIQFLGDTAPFLLLGVHAEVFAAYFVLYAINGFYQHSNADVRLGFLNYIIAGPELHRWHHSAKISEANANYGNNLIVWDAVFGTRFLPNDREVGRIGIGNQDWPNGFWAQMLAPFTTSTDASDR